MEGKRNKLVSTGKLVKVIALILGLAFVGFGVVRFLGNDSIGFGEDALFGVTLLLGGMLSAELLIRKGEAEEENEIAEHGDEGL